jgi:Catalase
VAEKSTRDFQDPKDTKKYLAARRGGTMHQIPDGAQGLLPGGIVADTRNTLRSGEQGLSLLEGFTSRVHITHLNHQRISELIVHVARASIGQATYRGGKAAVLVGGEGRVSEGAV